jgi:acyl-coenzyme A thioesterase PaaI-like protein
MSRPRFMQRVLRFFAERRLLPEARMLEWYPPFLAMRIKVVQLDRDWREVRIRLPLNAISRNPGGVMFGGYQAALADPVPALACARVFPGYSVWTRSMLVDFELGGSTDLELRFAFPEELEKTIREQLARDGRATPSFEYGYYLSDGRRCTRIVNTVAIRPRGYSKATTPPAPREGVN